MANTAGVCLIALSIFCFANLSSARQLPKECSKGPSYWCESVRKAADCGAVQHCIATVWETQDEPISPNPVSDKVVRLFKQLKDVKDLINPEYLGSRVSSSCRDLPFPAAKQLCKENTAALDDYLMHVLTSEVTPETMCRVVGLCNSLKLDNIIWVKSKKTQTADENKKSNVTPGKLVGSEKCTWGPSYWCSNFSTGRECRATHHCVQRVWSKLELPEDNDSVCKICLDMVKQARDQLESNETQEELKEVFEGSCKLIPIKTVAKECIKMADDFVPELVETLASQMNPQQVCSVAGLCNNARIDQLLQRYEARLKLHEDCDNCNTAVGVLRKRFDAASDQDFLVGLLKVCGRLGSFSDSCSMLMFSYYENIVAALKHDLTPRGVCHVSGQCAFKYHSHDEFTFPQAKLDQLKATDDVPCEFCEQLVLHLRDVLVANTTEMQFQKVLEGLCKQTGKFKDECLHLVEEYYAQIYSFLTKELKPAEVCQMMGLCQDNLSIASDVPITPLLPKELAVKAVQITPSSRLIGAEEAKIARIPMTKQANVRIMGSDPGSAPPPPLPIERMFVQVPRANKFTCTFCQSFLHYLQVELSDTNNEERVKEAVEKACDKLPQSIDSECRQFVTEYGPAVIALLVQQIDPSSVCPALRLCPQAEVRRVDINAEKSNCPLCLFAVEQLETMLKNNRSEESIRHALDGLCNHLSAKLRTQCVDFVDQYSNQLVEMLVADLNAQEICVYLKLCKDDSSHTDPLRLSHASIDKYHAHPQLMADRNNRRKPMLPKSMLVKQVRGGDIETNEIPDDTVNGRRGPSTVCVLCEFVMKEIDDEVKDKHNEDEIKKVVHGICKRMPKSVKGNCDQFVEKYADLIISLLAQELDPDEVCQELKLCQSSFGMDDVKHEILDCAVCETVVMAVKKVLTNEKIDHDIVHVVEKSCSLLPAKYSARIGRTAEYINQHVERLFYFIQLPPTTHLEVQPLQTFASTFKLPQGPLKIPYLPAKYSDRCHTMLEIYGDSIIHLIETMGTKGVCAKIGLCNDRDLGYVNAQRAAPSHH